MLPVALAVTATDQDVVDVCLLLILVEICGRTPSICSAIRGTRTCSPGVYDYRDGSK